MIYFLKWMKTMDLIMDLIFSRVTKEVNNGLSANTLSLKNRVDKKKKKNLD